MKSFLTFLLPVLFCIIPPSQLSAQSYYDVTHLSGTTTIGGTAVRVTQFNSPGTRTISCAGSDPYCIGDPLLNPISAYIYSFNSPVEHIRLQMLTIDSGETVEVYVNQSMYDLSTATISPYPCFVSTAILPIVVNGRLTSNTSIHVDGYGIIDIAPGYPIDSIRVLKGGLDVGGVVYGLKFAHDTIVYLNQPFNDTALCAGDSLYVNYRVSNKFNSGNTFSVQLSDASGSFASPVTIGFKTADTSGMVPCAIPSTAVGSGYRLRIISNSPARTSNNNGKNILIGNIRPGAVIASSNSPVCQGSALTLSAACSTASVTYRWIGPNGYISASQNPSVTSISANGGGDYIVSAMLNGCASKDTTSVIVNPLPNIPSITANSPLCIGSNITLSAVSTTPGVSYSWSGPAGFNSTLQNPVINSATAAMAGTYQVQALLNGCASAPASTTISIVAGPSVNIYPSPNDSICDGTMARFVAIPVNAGTTPQFQWFVNGAAVPGETSTVFMTNVLDDGDIVSCQLTASAGSACTDPINSISIPMTILPYLAPSVAITASPDTNLWPGLQVTFTATATNAGANPKYQWKVNGKDVIGAISNIWGSPSLNNNDSISCEVTSTYLCPQPGKATSNIIALKIATSVNKTTAEMDGISIYPNPAHDKLFVSGSEAYNYAIYDVTGRKELYGKLDNGRNIQVSMLNKGMHILQLINDKGYSKQLKINID